MSPHRTTDHSPRSEAVGTSPPRAVGLVLLIRLHSHEVEGLRSMPSIEINYLHIITNYVFTKIQRRSEVANGRSRQCGDAVRDDVLRYRSECLV
ncbi:hypothetical protein EVAR_91834_1 [Eumeta japonica]|uniref:Uncharacterized protein n=1 Tax=Eumeta variegata TaxID=151549 RepID=A0A4C2A801_EUMVA|nr:hypothetical protein EVAR_91834_1 [Eumeta japonica]